MKTKALLFVNFTVTLFAGGVLITTLFNTAPSTKDAMVMFYSSSFIFLFGLLFFSWFYLSWLRLSTAPHGSAVTGLVRNSLIIDSFILAILALRANGVLNLATGLVLLVGTVILMLVLRKKIG